MNKPRLIDADKLLRHLSDWWLSETPSGEVTVINNEVQKTPTNEIIEECIKVVEDQPTAYDIDKVVEQLEDEKEFHEQIEYSLLALGYRSAYKKAIEIVKKGGVNNDT